MSRRHAFFLFALYLVFVVYGSLVPFEYRARTLAQALQQFASITYLDLGVTSRADWIANIVLYVPLAFLACVWLLGLRTVGAARHLALIVVLAFCLAVAVGVEFTQIFFAPRTVSLNDLLAEALGTLAGITLWAFGRRRIVQLWDAFAEGGRPSVVSVIVSYGLLYAALSLFPYDFVVSAKELVWKLQSGNQGWLIAGNCGGWLRCAARLAAEALAVAPLGLLIALASPGLSLQRLFVIGVALGLVLEPLQFLLASGTSQGLSVILRGAGLAGGAAIGRLLCSAGLLPLAGFVLRATPFLALPYLLVLAGLNGWFSRPWLPLGEALGRIGEVRVMPFYYHYFSTEAHALASLLANAVMYAPVGLIVWARGVCTGSETKGGLLSAAFWAMLLALAVELGKLLVPPKHPDPTDLLIAAAGAALTHALALWVGRVLAGVQPDRHRARVRPLRPQPAEPFSG